MEAIGNPTGYVIHAGDRCLYYAGDTDLFSDMQLIAKRHQPEVAFLPLGDLFTMDIISACEAAIFLNVKRVIGMHYDTFSGIKIDHAQAINQFAASGIDLILMNIGETRTL
jgi:L-ascorbate metabolism protein UlaG (beta-lactamase superfamily)